MALRLVPPPLRDRLVTARRVEEAAVNTEQRLRAVRATGRLMLAAVEAGWRPVELAAALGMNRATVAVRVRRARARYPGGISGIAVCPPPVPDSLRPVAEREWLRARDVRQMLGISDATLEQWVRAGLMPATRTGSALARYARADVERASAAPKSVRGGIDRGALRAVIENHVQTKRAE